MSNLILMNRSYRDEKALDTVINYCANPYKCSGRFAYGMDISSEESVIEGMKYMRRFLDKKDGKQLCHFVITIDTPYSREKEYKWCAVVTKAVCLYWWQELGFQIAAYIHTNANKIHSHFVVNSLNLKTGKLIDNPTAILYELHKLLVSAYPDLCWQGVFFNKGENDDLDEM